MSARPLDGVRVIDLGVMLAGPYAGMLLADLGAEVIRVESTQHFPSSTRGERARPTREFVRSRPPLTGGYPDRDPGERPWNRFAWFNATARNKLGITCDLDQPLGQEMLRRLVCVSDILVSNQAPGSLARWGLDYESVRELNPRLIHVEASAFGGSGPLRGHRGGGQQIEAYAGHDLLRHDPHGDPSTSAWVVPSDQLGALSVATAAILALWARLDSGEGQHVDVSLAEGFIGAIGDVVLDCSVNGRVQQSLGNRHRFALQGCYPCAGDDRWLVLTIFDDAGWQGLAAALEQPELADDPRFATHALRRQQHDAVDEAVARWSRRRHRDDAVARLRAHGVVAGPVLDEADIYSDPHVAARGFLVEVEQADAGRHRYPGMPYRLAAAPLRVDRPPVRLGEHNDFVYRHILGVDDAEYRELEENGHIGTDFAPHIP
jgi:crotonobetainyl-CoA:carnitine CoA-transferase CaiB-like acyl-CoA transferase